MSEYEVLQEILFDDLSWLVRLFYLKITIQAPDIQLRRTDANYAIISSAGTRFPFLFYASATFIDSYILSEALWALDFIQTLPMEIQAVWFGKLSGPAILFLVNRYSFGISVIVEVLFSGPGSATDKR